MGVTASSTRRHQTPGSATQYVVCVRGCYQSRKIASNCWLSAVLHNGLGSILRTRILHTTFMMGVCWNLQAFA